MSMHEVVEYEVELRQRLSGGGMSENQAAAVAGAAAEALLDMFSGQQIYIPQDKDNNIQLRDIALRREYREFVIAICRKYGVSSSTFYKIIKGKARRPPQQPHQLSFIETLKK